MFQPACAADSSLACNIGDAWRKHVFRCCVRFCCPSPYWITEAIAMNWADHTVEQKSAENGVFRKSIHYVSCWRCLASNAQARFRSSRAPARELEKELF